MGYQIAIISLCSGFFVQITKFIIFLAENKKLNFRRLVETGGMPSAHSASVAALSTGVWLKEGGPSSLFAVVLVFSLIVIYEAAGLRRAAGQQAETLNKIVERLYRGEKITGMKLQEFLGHTPLEVFMGILLGITFALVFSGY